MNNYTFLKELGEKKLIEFVRRGIIPIVVMDYITIYDRYLLELNNHKKTTCITLCSDEYNVHENTIRNVIKFMTK